MSDQGKLGGFTDEVGELFKDAGKATVREVKDMGKIAKAQITGNYSDSSSNKPQTEIKPDDKKAGKKDPITGKTPPTKQQLNDLKQQTAQLQMAQLKKVRAELEKQRLKVSGQQQTGSPQVGPEVKEENKKPKDDAVQKTLKSSKSTGEFKGLIGG